VAEWKLFKGDKAHVSTFEFHEHRERAPHLEQPDHGPRLRKVAEVIHQLSPASVVDLGCGDGGLLSLIKDIPSWGYDFAPSNRAGWEERGVTDEAVDVFNDKPDIRWGELAVATEVIEHLQDPHGAVEWIARHAKYVVASSPWQDDMSGDCHSWAWDHEGYFNLFVNHFAVLDHFDVTWSQIIVGESRY
jgi:SAM-dependent methyltransferase